MFNKSKYTTWYYKIIDNATVRPIPFITERHHIIPRSLGGDDTENNIANLTPKEHYICHLLLTKMVIEQDAYDKMSNALWCMTNGFGTGERYRVSSKSKLYSVARINFIEAQKERQKGKNNSFYGKRHSIETRNKISKNNSMHRTEIREKCKGPRPGFMPHNHYSGWSEDTKKKISESLKGNIHSEDTREKMRKSKSNLVWINNPPNKPKQIKKELLETFLLDGWIRGRGPRNFW